MNCIFRCGIGESGTQYKGQWRRGCPHLPQCQGLGQCPPPARLRHDAIRESLSHLKTDIYQLLVELYSQTRVGQVVRRDCGHAAGAQAQGHGHGGRPHLLLHDLWPWHGPRTWTSMETTILDCSRWHEMPNVHSKKVNKISFELERLALKSALNSRWDSLF